MTKQIIDVGTQGNDGTGDSIRTSFQKVNDNFTELYAAFGAGGSLKFTSLGDAPSSYTANQLIMASTTGGGLTARTLVAGNNITIDATHNNSVTISAPATGLIVDAYPSLLKPLNASLKSIGRLADPSDAAVAEFNAAFASTPVSGGNVQYTTTIGQMAVTVNYANNNYLKIKNGKVVDPLRIRNQPLVPEYSDIDSPLNPSSTNYDLTLKGNYLATEAMQRKDVVYRGGDTMTGALTLSDHPSPLSGQGVVNNTADLQAATKFYVDNSSYTSANNLYVSTKGDDLQIKSPAGSEGRSWAYAYKTVGAAALRAEALVSLAQSEPGPYKQRIVYTQGPNQYDAVIKSVTPVGGNTGDTGYTSAVTLLKQNKEFIQKETIAYVNKKYVNTFTIDTDAYTAIIGNLVDAISYDVAIGSTWNPTAQVSALFNGTRSDIIANQISQLKAGMNYARDQILGYGYSQSKLNTYTSQIIDALCYDMYFGGNFQSIIAGLAYTNIATGLSAVETSSLLDPTTITVVSGTANGTTATLTFAQQVVVPYVVGSTILVSGMYPDNYNGPFIVDSVNATTVSYTCSATEDARTVGTICLNNVINNILALSAVSSSSIAVNSLTANANVIRSILLTGIVPTLNIPGNGITSTSKLNAKTLLLNNVAFIQAEITGYLQSNYPQVSVNNTTSKRDVKYIVWSLAYDLVYGGNSQSIYTGLQYWLNGVKQIASSEVTACSNAINYINTLAQNIITNTPPTTLYQQSINQYTNETLAILPKASFTGNITSNTLTATWVSGTITVGQLVSGGTTAAGTYITSNLTGSGSGGTSTWTVGGAPQTVVGGTTFTASSGVDVSISTNVTSIVNIVTAGTVPSPTVYTPTLSGSASELYTARSTIIDHKTADADSSRHGNLEGLAVTFVNLTYPSISTQSIIDSITSLFAAATNILDVGFLNSVPVTYGPSLQGTNTDHAVAGVLANLDFIADEAYAYAILNNSSPQWAPPGSTLNNENILKFKKNIKLAMQAALYDTAYGGNSGAVFTGKTYWNGITSLLLSSTERSIWANALQQASNAAQYCMHNADFSSLKTTTTNQVFNSLWADGDGGGGTNALGRFAASVNIIKDILQNNTNTPYTYPVLTSYTSAKQQAKTIITKTENKTAIVLSTNAYLSSTFTGGLIYNEGLCYRDIGLIIDGMIIDLQMGSASQAGGAPATYQGITAGKSYYRNASALKAISTTQRSPTIDAINFAKILGLQCLNQLKGVPLYQTAKAQYYNAGLVPSTSAKTDFSNDMNIIINIMTNGLGVAPTITAQSFGSGTYAIEIDNGGNGYVDQGVPGDVHIIPGKILLGNTSGALGQIVKYTSNTSSLRDTIIVRMTRPGFFDGSGSGETVDFAETVKDLNITINVESGIYYEDYPIRLAENVTVKGDDFRRTLIRPLNRVSQSPWRGIFFYRDSVIDGIQTGPIDFLGVDHATELVSGIQISASTGSITATLTTGQAPQSWLGLILTTGTSESGNPGKAVINSISGNILYCTVVYPFDSSYVGTTLASGTWHLYGTLNYGRHYLTNPLLVEDPISNPPKNNKDMDVFLVNDANRLKLISLQGHGGFVMVLDPEGQIKTKSPYAQECGSFSGSKNAKRFAGGQFIDGFAGRLFGNVTAVANSGLTITVTGSPNSGLDVRAPQVPCSFFIQGNRYQVNDVVTYDNANSQVVLTLDISTPFDISGAYTSATFTSTLDNIINAVAFDVALGSNYQSVRSGLTYLTPQYSTQLVGLGQALITQGLTKSGILLNALTGVSGLDDTGKTRVTNCFTTITNIINNGSGAVPTITYPKPNNLASSSPIVYAAAILQDASIKDFIKQEITGFIADTYIVRNIAGYSAVKSQRDIGYIVDALTYDLLYGGNSQTYDIAKTFWNTTTHTSYLKTTGSTTEKAVCLAAFGRLKVILSNIVQGQAITGGLNSGKANGNSIVQKLSADFSSHVGTTTEGNRLSATGGLVDVLIDIVTTETSTTYSRVNPTVDATTTTSALFSDFTNIGTAKTTNKTSTDTFILAGANLQINIEMAGNRSMLANDFTQINDLGYGIVATNGGLTEQVSTFSYYCYTGYWANNGGQVRSIAGSNSHGVYGLRATGFDNTEVPDAITMIEDMVQTAVVYKSGIYSTAMTPTTNTQALLVYVVGWQYKPFANSELEIDHTAAGGLISRYLITGAQHTSVTVNGVNVIQISLSTGGGSGSVGTGLLYPLYDGQLVTIRALQSIKFSGVANTKPSRPSTSLQYLDNLVDVYRILGYSVIDSTGEALDPGVAIIKTDSSFAYYKLVTDNSNIGQIDPTTSTITVTGASGTGSIATVTFSDRTIPYTVGQTIAINGVNPIGYNGVYVVTACTRTSVSFASTVVTTYVSGGVIGTRTLGAIAGDNKISILQISQSNYVAQINKGTYLTGWNGRTHRILGYVAQTYDGSGNITVPSYLTIDPNPVYNNATSGTSIPALTLLSSTAGVGTRRYIKYAIPFGTTPTVDGAYTITGNATASYNGTYQVTTVGNQSVITIPSTSNIAIGQSLIANSPLSGMASSGAGVFTISSPLITLVAGMGIVISGTNTGTSGSSVIVPGNYTISTVTSQTQFTISSLASATSGTIVGQTWVLQANSGQIPTNCVVQDVDTGGTQFTVSPAVWFPLNAGYFTTTTIRSVSSVSPSPAGSGYTSAPTISITGGGASLQAIITVEILDGSVSNITIVSPGSGYTSDPTVTVGTPWTATTAFTLNTQITSGSKLYTVTTAGTTGSSAPSATTVGQTVTNGSASLRYVGAAAGLVVALTPAVTGGGSINGVPSVIVNTNTATVLYPTDPGVVGSATASASSGSTITVVNTANLAVGQAITFSGTTSFGGITFGTMYYIVGINPGTPGTIQISGTKGGSALGVIDGLGSMSYSATSFTFASSPASFNVTSYGSVSGTGPYLVTLNITPSSAVVQYAYYRVSGNSNILYNGLWQCTSTTNGSTSAITLSYPYNPGTYGTGTTTIAKEVTTATSGQLGISKGFPTDQGATLRLGYPGSSSGQITTKISTCRATGHDFLDIGTGGYTTTNYPSLIYGPPAIAVKDSNQVVEETVGRVFYVTTDQNGIFRVGKFFTVDQGTGTVTFAASIALSNLDGLGFKRGVSISEFSTDETMGQNLSDIVPVQSAIRGYIDRRLGLTQGGNNVKSIDLLGPGFLDLTGKLGMKASLNMTNYKIINLATPVLIQDATNKVYVDTQNFMNGQYDVTIATPTAGDLIVYDTTSGYATATDTDNKITLSDIRRIVAGNIIIFSGTTFDNIITNVTYYVLSVESLSGTVGKVKVSATIFGTALGLGNNNDGGSNGLSYISARWRNTASPTVSRSLATEALSTSASGNGTYATLRFATAQATAPYSVGQKIIVSGVAPLAYNGAYNVYSCTTTSVTYACTATGNLTQAGTIHGNQLYLRYNNLEDTLTTSLHSDTVVNSMISSTAGIVQSKLTMQAAAAAYTSASVTLDQTRLGLSEFNSNVFSATNGFIDLKTSTDATTGILYGKIQFMATGKVLGNFSGSSASPREVDPGTIVTSGDGIKNASFTTSGAMTTNGSGSTSSGYSVTSISVANAADSLVKSASDKSVDVGSLKVAGALALQQTIEGSNTAIGLTTPNSYVIINSYGTNSTDSVVKLKGGTLDTSSGKLRASKISSSDDLVTTTIDLIGTFKVSGSSVIDLATNNSNLYTRTLSTSVGNTDYTQEGTIYGTWKLAANSKMQATYADLAEYYEGDQEYEPGTVLVFGGDKEVTMSNQMNDTRSAGVVTTNPAYTMNQDQTGIKVCIALAGRVPCKVVGRVKKGDMLTTSATPGYAVRVTTPTLGAIIGKALEDKDYGEAGVIQVAVGRV